MSEYAQQKAAVIMKVREMLGWSESKILLWFYSPNPLLGSVSPSDMLVLGRFKKLWKWILLQEYENCISEVNHGKD